MKKIILILVFFFNIVPCFKEDQFYFTCLISVNAQIFGAEDEGGNCYDETKTQTGTGEDTFGPYIEYSVESVTIDCNTGATIGISAPTQVREYVTTCNTTEKTLVASYNDFEKYEECITKKNCQTGETYSTDCNFIYVKYPSSINPDDGYSPIGGTGGGTGGGTSNSYPSSGSINLNTTTSVGGLDLTNSNNLFSGTGNWVITTTPNPGADLLNISIDFTLNVPVNINTSASGTNPANLFGTAVPIFDFNLKIYGTDGTLLKTWNLINSYSSGGTISINQPFLMPVQGSNYSITNWHNKNLSFQLEGSIYTGSWGNVSTVKALIGSTSWMGHVPQ